MVDEIEHLEEGRVQCGVRFWDRKPKLGGSEQGLKNQNLNSSESILVVLMHAEFILMAHQTFFVGKLKWYFQ